MFKKDHFGFGVLIGVLAPSAVFGFIRGINFLLVAIGAATQMMDMESIVLLSNLGNLFLIRYYFVSLKYEKTGRGVLVVTFALILIFFKLKNYF